MGNIVNRVFDSAGPEGKVRGTPQQIIEKYTVLARDAQLGGDRVAAENFQQHAEHYTRMLEEAQREQAERQAEQQQRQQQRNENGADDGDDQRDNRRDQAPRGIEMADDDKDDTGLVDLPENTDANAKSNANANGSDEGERPRRGRRPRSRAPKEDVIADEAAQTSGDSTEAAAE